MLQHIPFQIHLVGSKPNGIAIKQYEAYKMVCVLQNGVKSELEKLGLQLLAVDLGEVEVHPFQKGKK